MEEKFYKIWFYAGLSETPDLLRRPVGDVILNRNFLTPNSLNVPSNELYELHLRAFRSFSSHFSQVGKRKNNISGLY